MISLAGLFLVDSTTIRSMAMGAIMVVAVSILAAVTLLPVLMRLLGRRAYARGRIALALSRLARRWRNLPRRPGSTAPGVVRTTFWERWTARVMRRPWVAAIASAGVMLALAVPALSLAFGDGALRQFPKDDPARVGAELAAQKLGPGSSGPTQIVLGARQSCGTRRLPDGASPRSRGGEGIAPTALPRRACGADRGPAASRPREPPGPGDAGAPARRPAAHRRGGVEYRRDDRLR